MEDEINFTSFENYSIRNPKKLMLLAGLYHGNKFVICTKKSSASIEHIHRRMPMILKSEIEINYWLNFREVLDSSLNKQDFELEFYQTAPFVLKVQEKSIKCLLSLEDYQKEHGMGRFYTSSKKKFNDLENSVKQTQRFENLNLSGLKNIVKNFFFFNK
jgi:hypothetical protein